MTIKWMNNEWKTNENDNKAYWDQILILWKSILVYTWIRCGKTMSPPGKTLVTERRDEDTKLTDQLQYLLVF